MGIYLNPGNENYKEILSANIYVDKTMMINVMNQFISQGNKYICVSRPRRFGKTIAQNMLAAYYSKGCDSRDMFENLKIGSSDDFGKNLNSLNVIKIDLNSEYQNTNDKDNLIAILSDKIKDEMRDEYDDVEIKGQYSLAESILEVFKRTGEHFVILIDEYDVLVREQVSEELFKNYLSFLNGLFKSDTLRQAISLAYITGILPVVRDRIQSKLNNFREYTILNAGSLAEYIGFTDDEVKALCEEYNMDYEECRSWYDGYRQHGIEIYNPESVVRAMQDRKYMSYWSMTSTYQVIVDRLSHNFKGTKDAVIRMMAGEEVDVRTESYMNTMTDFKTRNDVFTYLMYLGYLAYDYDNETCRIPNREIVREWEFAVEVLDEYADTDDIIQASKELLKATIDGDEEMVANALDASHIHVTSNRSYNNEDALQSAIYLAYIYAINKYTIVREMTSGKGFADVVYIPLKQEDPALIIELKRNSSVESAINQIKEKKYFDSLNHYQGNIIFVAVNYDEKDKTHTCKIERFTK